MSSDTYYCERCEEQVTKGAHTCNAAKGWLIKQNKSLTDERDELLEALEDLFDLWEDACAEWHPFELKDDQIRVENTAHTLITRIKKGQGK